jgi:hypothetical protein
VYRLPGLETAHTYIIKLRIGSDLFIVTEEVITQGAVEVTRRTFFEFLKQHDDPTYQVDYKRSHQFMVGNLLDCLLYVTEQREKINSFGDLDITAYRLSLDERLHDVKPKPTKKNK